MIVYFFKRLLLFIPTLLLISVFIFFLSRQSSGDPALNKLERESKELNIDSRKELKTLKRKMGLDLPLFYWSVRRKTACPNPQDYSDKELVKRLEYLAYQVGSWWLVESYYQYLMELASQEGAMPEQKEQIRNLLAQSSIERIHEMVKAINHPELNSIVAKLKPVGFSSNNFLLTAQWHGPNNQYHLWISNLFQGDLGKSFIDGRAVSQKISLALYWTLILSVISIVLSFGIAIPTAVYAAASPHGNLDRFCNTLFFGFYALPSFWVATLLIVFFAGGDFLKWFPTYGLGHIQPDDSFWEILNIRLSHLILPIVCCTYGSLAFIYRQLRQSMQEQLDSDYLQAAKSKGLGKRRLLWNHAFRNAGFPLITILGYAFPATVSGAFVVEYIFAIPGMGKLTVDSFLARDFPVIFSIVLLISALTLIGSWVSDVVYHVVDPRFRINSSKV